jgi:hypothetical protein
MRPLFSGTGVLVFSLLVATPHWAVSVFLSAATSLAFLLHELSRHAHIGYQDEYGFHHSRRGPGATDWRKKFPPALALLSGEAAQSVNGMALVFTWK